MAEEYTAEEILEVQSEIARLQQEGKPIPEHLAKAYIDIAKGVRGYQDAIESSFKRLGSALINTTLDPQRGASKYGAVLDAGNQVVGALSKKSKKYGELVSGTSTALTILGKTALGAADTLFKGYQDLSTVGATGSEGITGLLDNLHEFSFSLDEMSSYGAMVKANSDILVRLGGTTNKGLRTLGKVSEEILAGGSDTEFYEMGMSTEAVNEGIMAYNRYQLMLGKVIKNDHDLNVRGSKEWIKTQRELAKITGQNVKIMEQKALDATREARFGSLLQILAQEDPKRAKELQILEQTVSGLLGDEVSKGFRDLSIGLVGNSEEAAKFSKTFPQAAQLITNGITDQSKIMEAMQKDAKLMGPVIAGVNRQNSELASRYYDISTLNRVAVEGNFEARKKAAAVEKNIQDKATSNQANIMASNRTLALTTDDLKEKGIAPALKAFVGLNEVLLKIIPFAKPIKPPEPSPGAQVPANLQRYMQAAALVESGGRADAKATTSSAGGLFQFIDSTWIATVKEMGKNYTLADKFDPVKSAEVMAYFTQKQQEKLEKGIGRPASSGDLYMAHFLGVNGAVKFINAMSSQPNQPAALLDAKAAAANRNIYYDKNGQPRSLQEVYQLMTQKIAKAESALDAGTWGGKPIPPHVAALSNTAAKPSAALGAVISGPSSGYRATLHGTEAVVPLGNGDSMKIKSVNHVDLIANNNMKIAQQLNSLQSLSNAIKDQLSVSTKILQRTV